MLSLLLSIIMIVHGAIHLMGLVKSIKPDSLPALTRPVGRAAGLLWFFCALLFAGATLLREFLDMWWMIALVGVILSQTLIITQWRDAKFGTVANLLILVAAILGYGQWQFHRDVRSSVEKLHQRAAATGKIIEEAQLTVLPSPVQRWLRRSGVVGRPMAQRAWLAQTGEMRTKPNGPWTPVIAEQWYSLDRPGFVWAATMSVGSELSVTGLDTYVDGKGAMKIAAMALYPIADSRGAEMDQGAMVRMLAEIVWVPSAALRDYVQWTPVGDNHARATLMDGAARVSADFQFNSSGDPESIDAKRYYTRESGATLEHWHIEMDPDGFVEFDGVRVPARSSVSWKLSEGDFEWFHVALTGLRFDGGD